jgi:hypothetical protein
MSEVLKARTQERLTFFQSICQEYGSAKVVELFVSCFGEELTGEALDKLGVAGVMPGAQLVKIYMKNRNSFDIKGELSHE